MYAKWVCELSTLDDVLEEINLQGQEIVGCFYTADAFQVVLIVKDGKKSSPLQKIWNGTSLET